MNNQEEKIFIAYRYSNPSNVIDILANIGVAIEAGVELAKKGHIPFVPHWDCLMGIWCKGELPKEYYQKNSIEWLKCCDSFLLLDKNDLNIKGSGVIKEYNLAKEMGKKIYTSIKEIKSIG